jgi:hypothetical protein
LPPVCYYVPVLWQLIICLFYGGASMPAATK